MNLLRQTKSRAIALVLVLAILSMGAGKCSAPKQLSTLEGVNKVENKLNQAANALNALAKTNRELYRQNVINLRERQQVATIINRANTGLDKAVDRAYAIDPNSPSSIFNGKADVVAILNAINTELATITFGPADLRLAVQAAISLFTEAVTLTNQIRATFASPTPTPTPESHAWLQNTVLPALALPPKGNMVSTEQRTASQLEVLP